MANVTQILSQIEQGNPNAADQLLPLVYEELRKLAALRLAKESPGQTLQATALVHEAYMRLVDNGDSKDWHGRRYFFSAAAEAMRRILVEKARNKQRQKRGENAQRVELQDYHVVTNSTADQLISVNEALEKLSEEDPLAAEVVKLRYYVGMSIADAADTLGIHRATAYRHWAYARAWIRAHVNQSDS